MKTGTFIMVVLAFMAFVLYTFSVAMWGKSLGNRVVIDKDLCYAVSSQQGQYIGFKLTLDKGYTAYICKGKVE